MSTAQMSVRAAVDRILNERGLERVNAVDVEEDDRYAAAPTASQRRLRGKDVVNERRGRNRQRDKSKERIGWNR